MSDDTGDDDDMLPKRTYQVGYGKPPEVNRYKKRQCGNDYGRKGKPENRERLKIRKLSQKERDDRTAYEKAASALVTINSPNGHKRVTRREALYEVAWTKALHGDYGLVKMLSQMEEKHGDLSKPKEQEEQRSGVMVLYASPTNEADAIAHVKERERQLLAQNREIDSRMRSERLQTTAEIETLKAEVAKLHGLLARGGGRTA